MCCCQLCKKGSWKGEGFVEVFWLEPNWPGGRGGHPARKLLKPGGLGGVHRSTL